MRTCDSTFEDILVGLNFSELQVWRRYICAMFLVNILKNSVACPSLILLDHGHPEGYPGTSIYLMHCFLQGPFPQPAVFWWIMVSARILIFLAITVLLWRAQTNILLLQNFLVKLHPYTWHLFYCVFHFYLLSLVFFCCVFIISVCL